MTPKPLPIAMEGAVMQGVVYLSHALRVCWPPYASTTLGLGVSLNRGKKALLHIPFGRTEKGSSREHFQGGREARGRSCERHLS